MGGFESMLTKNQLQGIQLFTPSGLRGYLDSSKNSNLAVKWLEPEAKENGAQNPGQFLNNICIKSLDQFPKGKFDSPPQQNVALKGEGLVWIHL